jgi:hypothetical protein
MIRKFSLQQSLQMAEQVRNFQDMFCLVKYMLNTNKEETTSRLSRPVATRPEETTSLCGHTEPIEPQNFDLSTLVQIFNSENLVANSAPNYNTSTVVEPLNSDCLNPLLIDRSLSNVDPHSFDLSTMVHGFHDASAYTFTENFDLSALVRPYGGSMLSAQGLISTQPGVVFHG